MRRRFWVVAVAAGVWCWFASNSQVAEALNGWTVRLAEMTLAEYQPGYGDTHWSTY